MNMRVLPLLVDIASLTERQSDIALNFIYKAIHDHGDDDIWQQHESLFIRRLIELFTERGLNRLSSLQLELVRWIDGKNHKAGIDRIARPEGYMQRWTEGEQQLARHYLEALPPGEFKLDDYMMVVDYLVQKYLPAADLRTEAQWLAVRSVLMGRVQANMDKVTASQADRLIASMPTTVAQAVGQFPMRPAQQAVLEYANAHAAENVVKMADDVRHKLRGVVLRHTEQTLMGETPPAHSLETTLQDNFASFNRDWRRIAVTEAGENANQGFIVSQKPGSKVRRIEHYRGACAFCKSIDGKVMEVVPANAVHKDGDTQVWPGKTNIGRSASPRRRQGGILVHREPEERWWIASGVQHPNCRGRWVEEVQPLPGDDPDFAAWLRDTLGKKHGNAV